MHTADRRDDRDAKPYVGVRALERALDIMTTLGERGRAKPSELACATDIDRTTVYRLLETLRRKGFVSSRGSDGTFALTHTVRDLGSGLSELDHVRDLVAPCLGELTHRVRWPSDFATFERGAMIIRETTHGASPLSVHRAMAGKARPVTLSALGRAMLCAAEPTERALMLELVAKGDQVDSNRAAAMAELGGWVADYERRQYAWSVNETEVGISAIALPVMRATRVFGAVNVIFFSKVMTPEVAAKRHLADLRRTVAAIESCFAEARSGALRDPPHPTSQRPRAGRRSSAGKSPRQRP